MRVEAESIAALTGRVEVVEPNQFTGWVRGAPRDYLPPALTRWVSRRPRQAGAVARP
jgi:hypothetical protein